ncbi:MAG: PEGA domain-containing protein, partial [Planctomycetota bacterium]
MKRIDILFVLTLILFSSPVFASGGRLHVKCNVAAKVYLNGIYVGETGKLISDLPAGEARLKVVAEGYVPHEEKIDITGGEVTIKNVVLKKGEGGTPGTPKPEEPGKPEVKAEEKKP